MSRYIIMPRTRQKTAQAWADDDWLEEPLRVHPTVDDHEAIDTGLITLNGDAIMRAPNPMGFGRDDEWA